MKKNKTEWRWEMAKRLARRINDEPTTAEIEEANRLVWRLCRLANDNARNCERSNSERMQFKWFAAKQEHIEERWCEREEEIRALFEKYGCSVYWPGLYPSIKASEGYDIDIWEMY